MPTLVRTNEKATKIAYKIMGKPANLAFKRNEEQKQIEKRLAFEEIVRVR